MRHAFGMRDRVLFIITLTLITVASLLPISATAQDSDSSWITVSPRV